MVNTQNQERRIIKISRITYFFWWCSGAVIPILEKHPTEKNKYVGMGAAIFGTWILATFSGIFAFYTIFKTSLVAIPLGITYGLLIFNLDRFITSSMKKVGNETEVYLAHEKFQNFIISELLPAIPRIIIAILIGLAISKPLELQLFAIEINKQLEKDREDDLNDYKLQLVKNGRDQKRQLRQQILALEIQISDKQNYIDRQTETLNEEVMGRMPSGLSGFGDRAKRLAGLIDGAHDEREQLKTEHSELKNKLANIDRFQESKLQQFEVEQLQNTGFFDRLEALSNLIKSPKNSSLYWANLLILSLIIIIETAPVLVKLISARGPYDAELTFENKRKMIENDRAVKDLIYKRKNLHN